MSEPLIALLVGGDEQSRLPTGTPTFVDNRGSTDVHKLAGRPQEGFRYLQITKDYFRHKRRHAFKTYDLLINSITDADQNSRVLEVLDKALKGSRVPILNHPAIVRGTTRERVARRLDGIDNLLVPRVRKIRTASATVLRGVADAGTMGFPAILRRAGTHAGRSSVVLDSPDEAPAGRLDPEGYYLTEFVDFRSADGLYRKFRVFVFGGTPVFRHMLISDSWNVHAADRERFMMARPELLEESLALHERGVEGFDPSLQAVIAQIGDRLGLDFFGVDFGLLADGRMVVFEANATMNFFPVSTDPRLAAMQSCVPPARDAFQRMIANALHGSDAASA